MLTEEKFVKELITQSVPAFTSPSPQTKRSLLHGINRTGGQNYQYIKEKHCIMYFGDVKVSSGLDSDSMLDDTDSQIIHTIAT